MVTARGGSAIVPAERRPFVPAEEPAGCVFRRENMPGPHGVVVSIDLARGTG